MTTGDACGRANNTDLGERLPMTTAALERSDRQTGALAASARALARSSTPILLPQPLFAYLYLSNELHRAPGDNHDLG